MDTSVPVVVFPSSHHGCLAIARSLGRLGVEVYNVGSDPRHPSLHSRYCRGKFIWNFDAATPEATVQYLLDIAQKIKRRSLLIHTYDQGAVLVADYADVLSEWYIFPHISPNLVRALVSKQEMGLTAKKYGVPSPEICFPQSTEDVEEYVSHATFPVMLKGIRGEVLELRSGWRMHITKTKEELLDLYHRYNDPSVPTFIFQEYIPGGDESTWVYNGYFDGNSECLMGITGQKIRQTPPYKGAISLGICRRNDDVYELTNRFMKDIGYKGIVDIGYRFDQRDGKYKILDINPRIGSSFRLFIGSNGIDVARAQYLDLTGQKVPSSGIIEGRKWMHEDNDLYSVRQYYRDGNLKMGQWISSYRGVKEGAWFAWDDLFPFFMVIKGFINNIIRHRISPFFKTSQKSTVS